MAGATTRRIFQSVVCIALAGCAPSLHGQLDDVERKIRDENARLDAVQRDIAASEARAADARGRAEFQECRATAASIQAEMTLQIAHCDEEKAKHEACGARNEAHTAQASVGGCLLGIGIMALTAGVGAPVAAVGCGAGLVYGNATTKACPGVACSDDPSLALATALATHRLERFPLCGGTLRVAIGKFAQVTGVEPNGPAAMAGITPGDVIFGIGGARTETTVDLLHVLGDHAPGELVDVVFLRGSQAFHVPLRLAKPK